MKYKLLNIITLLLVTSCGLKSNYSKYEIVYSTTINQDEYDKIFQILGENLDDLSRNKNQTIKYSKRNEEYSLKINLKAHSFKLDYRSNKGKNDNIELIKSKIVAIKNK